jgi:hypothetical protein
MDGLLFLRATTTLLLGRLQVFFHCMVESVALHRQFYSLFVFVHMLVETSFMNYCLRFDSIDFAGF